MKKQRKLKVLFVLIVLVVVVLVLAGITLGNKTTKSVITANIDATNAENDAEVEAIMQLDASGDKVPVPEGYIGSSATGENEIDTGYVIYEGTEPVTDSNVATAKTTRNQYVWVPVPDASKMYGTDANGKKWGKLYYFETSSTNDNYDELTGSYPNNWSETNGVMEITSSTSYREPDVVPKSSTTSSSAYDMDSRLKTLELGAETAQEFLMQLEQEFNNMIKSVEKYGGFYIGRYETGDLNQDTAVVQKGNSNIASQTWYTMYKKCKTLKGSNNKVETGMIWGSQWDRTLMWLVESGNKTKEEICESSNWGYYSNQTESGYSESWKANNIYDLAGNKREWTIEADRDLYRVIRDNSMFSGNSASNRYYNSPTSSRSSYGCRGVLYIK